MHFMNFCYRVLKNIGSPNMKLFTGGFQSCNSYFQSFNSYFQSFNSYFESFNSYFESLNSHLEMINPDDKELKYFQLFLVQRCG